MDIPKLEPPLKIDSPTSIPTKEILPLYPSCKTIPQDNVAFARESDGQVAIGEVAIINDSRTYFFKHVRRHPKEHAIREVTALATFRHPHIVLLGAIVLDPTGDVVGLLFPFAERGTLNEAIKLKVTNEQKLRWICDIVDAPSYLASVGYSYDDIKLILSFSKMHGWGSSILMVEELVDTFSGS